ncbi:putative kinase-like protein TMKL1 [Dichanthelium oligosanthes]|uniref:Putative kinase-like protein TMKL1 n=1 Tax=Dichanthelium oligosanthes TaxID=888268 RepID=A0A1E5W0Q7_9POAL|nr:putative kinase-like protein TMKL1 [Dichanthelium oligosanthes]
MSSSLHRFDSMLLLLHPCRLLLLLFLFFFQLPLQVSSSDAALLLSKVKPALQGKAAPNAQLATWNTSIPLCLWRGLRWSTPDARPLRCDTAAARANLSLATDPAAALLLVSIRLPAAALAGTLPPELGAFSALDSIYLAANSLSGPVPLDLGNAPALSALDLSANRLSGHLPTSIWNLCDRLTDLRLHANALTGGIPAPAGPNTTCDRLRLLDLGANRFSGAFPSFVTAFRGLQRLDLSSNRLQGPIPDALAGIAPAALNLSYNNFSGQLPAAFSRFPPESFLGNDPSLCGPPLLRQCVSSSGLSSRGVAGMVIGLMAAAVVLASVSIGWAQGRWTRRRDTQGAEGDMLQPPYREEDDQGQEGRLVIFEGGEHLTLEEVLNATGQVVDKTSYCTVYKAKLASSGGSIQLRLLREGCCKDAASCAPVVRRIGRARHDNLVPLRAFYQGRRGEKLLVYDYFPRSRTLQDLLHGGAISSGEGRPALTWARRHKIALGTARALAYLHTGQGEAHGNVRSSNVVVDELLVARLAEHAVDRLLVPAAAEAVLAVAKADGYKAPELQSMRRCSARTDVYAFGILLLELLMGRKPSVDLPSVVKVAVLEETALEEVLDAEVVKGLRMSPAEEGLLQALRLAMGCCAPVAAARPSMAEVVRQLEESRPCRSVQQPRSALYSPAESRSDAGTPTTGS